MIDELKRIIGVSDMLVTMHSKLRDRYQFYSIVISLLILCSSIWLSSMVFVEPVIGKKLSPDWVEPRIWIGILSLSTFFLALFQMTVKWREKGESHGNAAFLFNKIKKDAKILIGTSEDISKAEYSNLINRYHAISESTATIPESKFLSLKKSDKNKVALGKILDKHP